MDLLAALGTPPPLGDDGAIKFNLLSAVANSRLERLDVAAQELGEARRLAEVTHSRLMGEVLRDEALMERAAGHPDKALEKFRESLNVARQNGDLLTQAVDFVDISLAALNSDRFEEALEITQEAVAFTRSIQARRQLADGDRKHGVGLLQLGRLRARSGDFSGGRAPGARIRAGECSE
jgi:tetratricopeptide (TPR) repeat protein